MSSISWMFNQVEIQQLQWGAESQNPWLRLLSMWEYLCRFVKWNFWLKANSSLPPRTNWKHWESHHWHDVLITTSQIARWGWHHQRKKNGTRVVSLRSTQLCTSHMIFLFYQQITSVKQQGRDLLVSHLYSRHKWRCWHTRWLPVNNAQWALLDGGFSIAWN